MQNHEHDITDAARADIKKVEAFVVTPDRQGLIDQLLHLLQFGEGLPVLLGEDGTGKSTLLKQLCVALSGVDFCCYCPVDEAADLSVSLSKVCQRLGVSVGARANAGEMLVGLRHFGQALATEQRQGVLLLDDAHRLDDSSLGAFLSLLQGHESGYGLSVLFAGTPELVERLDAMQLVEVPVYDFEVPPLSCAELGELLQLKGLMMPDSGDSELVRNLWVKSMGRPGAAIRLLETRFLASAEKGRPRLPGARMLASLPVGHLAAMTLLIGVLLWAMLGRREQEPPLSATTSPALTPPAFVAPSPLPLPSPSSLPSPSPLPLASLSSSADVDEASVLTADAPDIEVSGSVTDLEATGTSAVEQVPPAADSVLSINIPTSTPVPELISESEPVVSASLIIPAESVAVEKSTTEAPSLSSPSVRGDKALPGVGDEGDEVFILAQPDSYYTLQVLAASKKDSLQRYIERQPNREQLYLYRGSRQGKQLYVVVAGMFPDQRAAMSGLDSLPEEQRQAGPWPRSLKSIKAEITESTNSSKN